MEKEPVNKVSRAYSGHCRANLLEGSIDKSAINLANSVLDSCQRQTEKLRQRIAELEAENKELRDRL